MWDTVFLNIPHQKATQFRHNFRIVGSVGGFSKAFIKKHKIKQLIQNTTIKFVQLYFGIGVDFLADMKYNIFSGRQKVEVIK